MALLHTPTSYLLHQVRLSPAEARGVYPAPAAALDTSAAALRPGFEFIEDGRVSRVDRVAICRGLGGFVTLRCSGRTLSRFRGRPILCGKSLRTLGYIDELASDIR